MAEFPLPGLQCPPGKEMTEFEGHVFVRQLGVGQYGVAKLFRNVATGETVAVKFLERGEPIASRLAAVEREIYNHRELSRHPSVVKFRKVFLTPTHLGIAMDYAAGGELFKRVVAARRFEEDVARYFFQQLISGVAWCHSKGVCHRDLKLDNALLDRPVPNLSLATLLEDLPRLKICDFGDSKASGIDSQPDSVVGTPAYVAPEVMRRGKYNGFVADVWACGVAMYVMLVGAYPFCDPQEPRNLRKMVKRIISVQYTVPRHVSPYCADLLSRIFVADPAQRITLEAIQRHPWFLRNLPPELQSANHGAMEVGPQFEQSDDEVRRLILLACALDKTVALSRFLGVGREEDVEDSRHDDEELRDMEDG